MYMYILRKLLVTNDTSKFPVQFPPRIVDDLYSWPSCFIFNLNDFLINFYNTGICQNLFQLCLARFVATYVLDETNTNYNMVFYRISLFCVYYSLVSNFLDKRKKCGSCS